MSRYSIHLFVFFSFLFFSTGCANHLNRGSSSGNFHPVPDTTDSINGIELNANDISSSKPDHLAESNGSFDNISPDTVDNENPIVCDMQATEESDLTNTIQPILDQALDLCQASQDFWQAGESENAIQALDQAYSLILNVNIQNSPKVMQQKEDLRFMISKRILEIYASRHIAVKGDHNPIPISLNKHVQAEIQRFTHREKKFFIQSFKRSGKYRPYILKSLKEAGLPEELSWLPLIESGFKVNALSSARALGLWQFIPSTGYKFGLKRNMFVDERLDPVRSTKAAIAYLKELHQIFGDWSTVLAAYNCGENRVLRTIRSQNINYLDNFWDLYDRLPRETARYVPRFLATLHIVQNLEKYGFDTLSVDSPTEFEIVNVSKQVNLKNLSSKIGVSYNILKELNPELRYKILPPDSYELRVPPGKEKIILAKIHKISISSPPQRAFVYHKVRHGESLSAIARRYHVPVRLIARTNHINKCNYIVAGKILKIPQNSASTHNPIKEASAKREKTFKYVVKKGNSLWNIANRYGTTTKRIRQLNRLSSSRLHIGQALKIPARKSKTSNIYSVKRGDNPFTIASQHNMDLKRLLKLNRLTGKSKIYPGQKLYVE